MLTQAALFQHSVGVCGIKWITGNSQVTAGYPIFFLCQSYLSFFTVFESFVSASAFVCLFLLFFRVIEASSLT